MPKAGLTVAVWAVGTGRDEGASTASGGNRVGKDGPAQPSPAAQGPGPRTREMLVAQLGGAGRQAGVADSPCARAREIWHSTHSRYSDG